MQDYPATAKFLSSSEKQEVQRRLEEDRSALSDEFDLKYFWDALRDWKIWLVLFLPAFCFTHKDFVRSMH